MAQALLAAGTIAVAVVVACVAATGKAERNAQTAATTAVQATAVPPTAATQKSGGKMNVQAAPDLAKRLARYRRVEMPFQSKGLTAREREMVVTLADAAGYLEDIYWRQVGSASAGAL